MNFKRGTLYLILAWASLPLTGYVLNVWLARYFGPESYGTYGLVMSILTWLEIFVITGLPYSVQKFVASDEQNAHAILWTAGRIQIIVVMGLFSICFLAAPLLAALYKNDRLVPYFRVAILHLVFYGFFHLLVAFQNGLRRFGRQALLFVVYSVGKMGFVFLLVVLLHSLSAAFLANSAGSLVALLVGILFIRDREKRPVYKSRELVRFAIPTLLFTMTFTLILNVDLWVVRYFLGDKISGLYFAASMIARIPYFLVLGVTATVLPTVSWQLATDAMDKARSTIESSLRFLLLVALPIGILLTMYGHETVHLLYSSEFLSAGSILTVLIWGVIFLSFMLLLMTIMIADHRPEMAFCVTVLAVLIDIVLNILFVPRYGAVGGAMSTTIAAGFGSVTAMIFVFRRFRVMVNITSLLRIGFAGVLLWLGVEIVGVQGNTFIWVSIAGLLFYFFLLFIFREVTWQDLLNLLPGRDDEDTIPSPHSDSIPM